MRGEKLILKHKVTLEETHQVVNTSLSGGGAAAGPLLSKRLLRGKVSYIDPDSSIVYKQHNLYTFKLRAKKYFFSLKHDGNEGVSPAHKSVVFIRRLKPLGLPTL